MRGRGDEGTKEVEGTGGRGRGIHSIWMNTLPRGPFTLGRHQRDSWKWKWWNVICICCYGKYFGTISLVLKVNICKAKKKLKDYYFDNVFLVFFLTFLAL